MVGEIQSNCEGDKMVRDYNSQLLRYTRQFEKATGKYIYTAKEAAKWLMEMGLWKAPERVALQRCAEDLSRAWREEYRTDPQGRRVRIRHAFLVSDRAEQLHLWGNWENLKPKQMALSFQGRRKQIVGECRQLKNDVDSYNENKNKSGLPIPMSYNFTLDMEETERKRSSISNVAIEPMPLSAQSPDVPQRKASERVLPHP
jgi:hypothetical protein